MALVVKVQKPCALELADFSHSLHRVLRNWISRCCIPWFERASSVWREGSALLLREGNLKVQIPQTWSLGRRKIEADCCDNALGRISAVWNRRYAHISPHPIKCTYSPIENICDTMHNDPAGQSSSIASSFEIFQKSSSRQSIFWLW